MLQRLRESDDPRFAEVSSEIEALLAEGSEFSEPSLCAVAALGNVEIMQQVLSKGGDVDKADYCGRTALVWPSNLSSMVIPLSDYSRVAEGVGFRE